LGSAEIGLSYFSPQRGYQVSESLAQGQGGAFSLASGKVDSESEQFFIPYLAGHWAIDDKQGISVLFYGRGGMNTDYREGSARFDADGPGALPVADYSGTFGAGEVGVDLSQAFLELAYGRQIGNFNFGIAPVFAIQTFEAKGLANFAPYTKTFAASGGTQRPQKLTNNGYDQSYGAGLKFGLIWSPVEALRLGLAYQSKIDMSEFDDYADLFAGGGDFDIPSSVRAGVSIDASESLTLHFDVEQTYYSEVDSVANGLSLLAQCPSAMQGGTRLDNCAGGKQGFGFGWDDVTTYKLGLTWQPSGAPEYRLRAGYSQGKQPIDARDVTINILAPGVIEEHFTLGVERSFSSGESLRVALMYAPKNEVSGSNYFDPTQQVTLSMSQYEIEVAYSF
jgi:long-chain fatty acid transport protein